MPLSSSKGSSELLKRFATQTFNNLSLALAKHELKSDCVLLQAIGQRITSGDNRTVLCCGVFASASHAHTAVKFCGKIRAAVAKRVLKDRRQVLSLENELAAMS